MASARDTREAYAQERLAPVLEAMTAACLREMPADLVPWMAQWLDEQQEIDLTEDELRQSIVARYSGDADELEQSPKSVDMGTWLPGASSFDPARVEVTVLPGGLCGVGIVLENVLTRRECLQIIEATEVLGYGRLGRQGAGSKTGAMYRGNRRVQVEDSECHLGAELFRRIRAFVPEREEVPGEGSFMAAGLNPRYRFAKYYKSEGFAGHVDKPTIYEQDRLTILTVNIYLNDLTPEQKGRTRFFASNKPRAEVVASAGGVAGSVVIFKQSCFDGSPWHDGEEVAEGLKYLMRTDVVYNKVF